MHCNNSIRGMISTSFDLFLTVRGDSPVTRSTCDEIRTGSSGIDTTAIREPHVAGARLYLFCLNYRRDSGHPVVAVQRADTSRVESQSVEIEGRQFSAPEEMGRIQTLFGRPFRFNELVEFTKHCTGKHVFGRVR